MVNGVNHAKKIVIDEANDLAEKLTNGNASCPETQGKAIALLVKMITPLYTAEFVTIENCQKKHKDNDEITELSVGPMHIKGRLNFMIVMILLLAGGVLFAIGKTEGWW